MKVLFSDTTQEVQRMHYILMRRLPESRRLALAFALTEGLRKLILADLRQKSPGANDEEIRCRFIARVLPREEVIRVYGFDPKEAGY